ncbi:MAG: DNA methyltransferase [Bacteroidota bacterium]
MSESSTTKAAITKLIEYIQILKGDEKGEAQVFCDRLFQAFGHQGYKEAGAVLEERLKGKKDRSTKFADLVWGERLLLEMKKRGAKLETHRAQVFDYWWKMRPRQPHYVVLCNFDEFWIYDFSVQDEPLDKIQSDRLRERYSALNFLFPEPLEPTFENNLVDVSRSAANKVAETFNALIARGEDRELAQKFILQSVFAMFAEDFDLLPKDIYTSLLKEGLSSGNTYDLIGGLFQQMAAKKPARGGRYQGVDYFNGGLFDEVDPIELNNAETDLLHQAAIENWAKINPSIFGGLFESSMDEGERHAFGAHFTSELDIYKVVHPCIIQPWREKIGKANTLKELKALRREIIKYKVLDPACGSGNFLYIAFRELKRLEMEILNKIYQLFPKTAHKEIGTTSQVSVKQFYGIDKNPFAVELAKVTLMLGKEIAAEETKNWIDTDQLAIGFQMESTLPLENLDDNIIEADALFSDWPEVDVIIGNPPFQSKNKMQEEFGAEYVNLLHSSFPEVPGRADFCVYWYYKAHKVMKQGGLAGLVGTNTIRQNYSREGGLDYIVKNDGQIFDAVSSQTWSGDAVVFVSIVNWVKGEYSGDRNLIVEENGTLRNYRLDSINSSLSPRTDVTSAKKLETIKSQKVVFQGQTHGHSAFLLSKEKANSILDSKPKYSRVLSPYLIGDELLGTSTPGPKRYVIDLSELDIFEASEYKELFHIIEQGVLPDRKIKAKKQEGENQKLREKNPKAKANKHHINFYRNWWKLSYHRAKMLEKLSSLSRYIVCSRVSARPIFEFVSSSIRPNDSLSVFALEDDYSFGIIHSKVHILWYQEKCSSMKGDPRYTSNSIWDFFPWPQSPNQSEIEAVVRASKELRKNRKRIMETHSKSLREIYRIMEKPGVNPLRMLHNTLDKAVMKAYGFDGRKDILTQVLALNHSLAEAEASGMTIEAAGLPSYIQNPQEYISEDCIQI